MKNKTKWLEFDQDSGCYIDKTKSNDNLDDLSIYENMLSQKEIDKIRQCNYLGTLYR